MLFNRNGNNHAKNGGPPTPLNQERPGEPVIRMRDVQKVYKTAAGEFTALKSIDLDVYPGEFLGIIGKSGAGKTTLINMLTGVDHLSAGEVWLNGVHVNRLDENQLALWRGRQIGIIYQSFHLMPNLSLLQNVVLPIDVCGLYEPGKSEARAAELLRMVELEDHMHKKPAAISGGQQQRVAIARALANNPPVIVADEPTGRLDSSTAEIIFRIFGSLVDQGKLIVMVSHDKSLSRRVSRTLEIADGEIWHTNGKSGNGSSGNGSSGNGSSGNGSSGPGLPGNEAIGYQFHSDLQPPAPGSLILN